MGYSTRFELGWEQVDDVDRSTPQCEHEIPEGALFCPRCGRQVRNAPVGDAILDFLDNHPDEYYGALSEDPAKWYDCEKQMRILSAKFPFMLFTLHGEGEESGDIWVEYYLDGKMQREKAKIAFDPFDPKKLK